MAKPKYREASQLALWRGACDTWWPIKRGRVALTTGPTAPRNEVVMQSKPTALQRIIADNDSRNGSVVTRLIRIIECPDLDPDENGLYPDVPKGQCPSGKRAYYQERLANRAVTEAARRGELPPMRHYKCGECDWWHLLRKNRPIPRPDGMGGSNDFPSSGATKFTANSELQETGLAALDERSMDNPRVCHIIEEDGRTLCGLPPNSGRGVHPLEQCGVENHPFCVVCTAMEASQL